MLRLKGHFKPVEESPVTQQPNAPRLHSHGETHVSGYRSEPWYFNRDFPKVSQRHSADSHGALRERRSRVNSEGRHEGFGEKAVVRSGVQQPESRQALRTMYQRNSYLRPPASPPLRKRSIALCYLGEVRKFSFRHGQSKKDRNLGRRNTEDNRVSLAGALCSAQYLLQVGSINHNPLYIVRKSDPGAYGHPSS